MPRHSRSVPLSDSAGKFRVSSTTSTAPSTAPHGVPAPPISGMKMARNTMWTVNVSGVMPAHEAGEQRPGQRGHHGAEAQGHQHERRHAHAGGLDGQRHLAHRRARSTPHGLWRSRSMPQASSTTSAAASTTCWWRVGSQPSRSSGPDAVHAAGAAGDAVGVEQPGLERGAEQQRHRREVEARQASGGEPEHQRQRPPRSTGPTSQASPDRQARCRATSGRPQ